MQGTSGADHAGVPSTATVEVTVAPSSSCHARVSEGVAKSQFPLQGCGFLKWRARIYALPPPSDTLGKSSVDGSIARPLQGLGSRRCQTLGQTQNHPGELCVVKDTLERPKSQIMHVPFRMSMLRLLKSRCATCPEREEDCSEVDSVPLRYKCVNLESRKRQSREDIGTQDIKTGEFLRKLQNIHAWIDQEKDAIQGCPRPPSRRLERRGALFSTRLVR